MFAAEGRQNLIKAEQNDELQKYVTGIVSAQKQKLIAINNLPDLLHLLVGLPRGRTFEFKVLGDDVILRGKVGAEIENADVLNRQFLHKHVSVKFHVIQVGEGRPRYTLQVLSDINE